MKLVILPQNIKAYENRKNEGVALPQKEDPFECGIPTRGRSWMQFRVGYYLFAILFLMFDVETMFLFPWAVVMRTLGPAALLSIGFFLFILVLGLAYAWKKGALEWQ